MSNFQNLQKLVIDIETVGVNYDDLDDISKAHIKDHAEDDDDFECIKERLGLSPLTGKTVAIGILNPDTGKGAVFLSLPDGEKNDLPKELEPGIALEIGTEEEMMKKFWDAARAYNCFIDFNGRGFDIPFLMIRSAILGIQPTKNLMSNRYLFSQDRNAIHVDLWDQLSFYGASRFERTGLHFWTQAFGIKSPKGDGVCGSDVGKLYEEKKYFDIAKYNFADVKATAELFRKWEKYLNA